MIFRKSHLETELVPGGCKYATLVPEDNPGNLPLLYLLHGGNGDRRFLASMQPVIEEAIAKDWLDPFVVVTPSAGMSYYMDFADGSEKWETLISGALTQRIIKDHGVDPNRRIVSGISMGGVGCLRLAFRNPNHFVAVAALEPGVDPFLSLADKPAWYTLTEGGRLGAGFGSPINEAFWQSNNPASIAIEAPASLKPLKIMLEVGTRDGLFNHHNVEFLHRVLFDQGIEHEYRTYLGANHIGDSLPDRMLEALKFLGRALRPEVVDDAADRFSQSILEAYHQQGILTPDQLIAEGIDEPTASKT